MTTHAGVAPDGVFHWRQIMAPARAGPYAIPVMGRLVFSSFLLLSVACAHQGDPRSYAELRAVVEAPDRPASDKALDPEREPARFLAFTRVGEGMQVGELLAGSGYTTELLARAVGPVGIVYGHNAKRSLGQNAERSWDARLQRLPNVLRLDRDLEDPFPVDLQASLDLVVSNSTYHDTAWLETDRAQLNRAVFRALKSGGRYVVCDSIAGEGRGDGDAATLHRIEDVTVKREVLAAGFTLEDDAGYLRNPSDNRDWNGSPVAKADKPEEKDRFCFRFRKP